MQIIFKFLMFAGVAAAVSLCAYGAITWSDKGPNKRPHIIFIVADDMGWNDVSFHGADQIPTPNIDALAYNGVILNRHYVQPICTPSRTALLTGRYPIREGMQGSPLKAGEARGIPLNATLLPEYLRNLGYATNLVGKWHVGYLTECHTPARRGFDSFYGYYSGFISYFGHSILQTYDNTSATGHDLHRDSFESLGVTYGVEYFTDLISDEAEKIIMTNGNDKPLFLEIAHLAVHASGTDDPLEVRDLTELNATFPYIKDFNRRKYAGMMKALDDSVGRVVTALNDAKMLENSIIVFIADNGAPTVGMYENTGSNYPLRGIKNTLFEGGVRGAACVFSPLIKTPSRLMEQPMHIVDWLPTLYAAAGGDPHVDLLDIDGQNQWPALVKATTSARQSILLNINEVTGNEGAIIGRYKLIKGADAEGEGYYGESGNDPSYPRYEVEDAMTSPAGLAISRLPKFISPSVKKMQRLRETSKVSCKKVTSYPNCSSLCLFDIYNDPCETHDLSQQRPKVVETLESFIDEYRKVLMPQTNTNVDICALPKYFNGTWMPWRRKDIDYDSLPKGTCRHPEDLFKKNHTIKSY